MSRAITLALALLAITSLFGQTPAGAKPPNDSAHVVIKKRYPVIYSPVAEEKKLHGTVVLSVLFNEAGAEENAELVSGDPTLAECATALIGKWQIESFIRGGKPVKVKVPLTFEFVDETPAASFSTGEVSSESDGAVVDRVTLSSRSTKEMLVKKVPPEYPQIAKTAQIEGTVYFAALVGKDGAIHELYALDGDPILAKAAADAVRLWRYKPYIYHGNPVSFDLRIQVNFLHSRPFTQK